MRTTPRTARWIAPALLCVWIALPGCQQRQLYSARHLPAELIAPSHVRAAAVNLSHLRKRATDSQRIHAGDIVKLSIRTGLDESDPEPSLVRVDHDGRVGVPLVGPVAVGGLTLSQAEAVIRDESVRRGIYRSPNVSMLIDSRRTHRITVMGAVADPGLKELPVSDSNLLAAIVEAGGLSEKAGTLVEVMTPGDEPPVQHVSYAPENDRRTLRSRWVDLARAADDDPPLADGSVVTVLEQPPRSVYVIGLVNRPDEIEIPPDRDFHVLDAISKAGGLTLQVANKVRVIRRVPGRDEPVVIATTIRDAKHHGAANVRLAAGDVVSVEETPVTFTVDTLRSFMRFGFSSAIPGL